MTRQQLGSQPSGPHGPGGSESKSGGRNENQTRTHARTVEI